MAKVKFDKRKFENAIRQTVVKGVTDRAARITRGMNALIPTHQGKPVDEVKTAVQAVWRRHMSKNLSEPKLTKLAEQIAAGGTVKVDVTLK